MLQSKQYSKRLGVINCRPEPVSQFLTSVTDFEQVVTAQFLTIWSQFRRRRRYNTGPGTGHGAYAATYIPQVYIYWSVGVTEHKEWVW